MRPISAEKKNEILVNIDIGLSERNIASIVGLSRSIIRNIRYSNRQNATRPKTGRPPKLSARDKRFLRRAVTSGKITTAVQANRRLESELKVSVSDNTVPRALNKAGLNSSVKKSKPLLSQKNIKKRLAFAKRHQHWTIAVWEQVIWSDEIKINRFCSDGRSWFWARDVNNKQPHMIKQTVKHGGGSLMIWGCMTIHGPGFYV